MADFRVFLLDRHDHIVDVAVVSCGSDGEALVRAAEMVTNESGVEVWEFGRFIGKVPARQLPGLDSTAPGQVGMLFEEHDLVGIG